MPRAITNTSPLIYLHRIGAIEWLPNLFEEVWTPEAVAHELREGLRLQADSPDPSTLPWLQVMEPSKAPSEWLSSDLGPGELAAIALGLEHPTRLVILDDALARRTAQAAGLKVWGTLRVVLEAKSQGVTDKATPWVDRLAHAGLWFSDDIRQRILRLAGET
ncbi:MAG: DUF3368 domain-containing protein [Acidobacteriota bacterium]